MKWTKDEPTEEGWYYWRMDRRIHDPLHWHVLYVEPDLIPRAKGQWAGPLPQPDE